MATNYFRISRDIIDWEYYNDPLVMLVFIHLIQKANYTKKVWHGVEIDVGQCLVGRLSLAQELKISPDQVKYYLGKLKKSGVISTKSPNNATKNGTLVTIERYGIFDNIKEFVPQEITKEITPKTPKKKPLHNTVIQKVIIYLNEKAKTNYKITTESTIRLIERRIKDGFTEDDFYKVIDNQVDSWLGTDYEKYLRPQTLFGNKFESYLNAKRTQRLDEYSKYKELN